MCKDGKKSLEKIATTKITLINNATFKLCSQQKKRLNKHKHWHNGNDDAHNTRIRRIKAFVLLVVKSRENALLQA